MTARIEPLDPHLPVSRKNEHRDALFSVLGVGIRLDPSVALTFILITYSLATGILPAWHPAWSSALVWGTALVSSVLFFGSLLAHELSHALVARRFGIPVPRITLFLFGGMAEMESEARSPRAEFAMAIAGPLMSLLLAAGFLAVSSVIMGATSRQLFADDPSQAFASFSSMVTAGIWVGSINVVLALFNLIPGFPLDGGRVLRAGIWWWTGNRPLATRMAAGGGRLFGWMLMGWVWILLAQRDASGLWTILVGWFLAHLAWESVRQDVMTMQLQAVSVRDVMRTPVGTVEGNASLTTFIDEHLQHNDQAIWPVLDGAVVTGLVGMREVIACAPQQRSGTRVRDIQQPLQKCIQVSTAATLTDVLPLLAPDSQSQVAVVDDGKVVGIVSSADVLRYIQLHPAIRTFPERDQ